MGLLFPKFLTKPQLPVPNDVYLVTPILSLSWSFDGSQKMDLLPRHFTAIVWHKPKQISWNLSLKIDYLKNQNPLSLELDYLFPQDICFCLKRVMWCVTQLMLLSIPTMCLNSSAFLYSGSEGPLGWLSKLPCFLLTFKYLPILLPLLHLGLFPCQVTKREPWTSGREDSLDLRVLHLRHKTLSSASQPSLKLTSLRKCLMGFSLLPGGRYCLRVDGGGGGGEGVETEQCLCLPQLSGPTQTLLPYRVSSHSAQRPPSQARYFVAIQQDIKEDLEGSFGSMLAFWRSKP